MLNLVRPRYFRPGPWRVPAACEARRLAQHLRHAGLEETFVLESGETLEIDKGRAQRRESDGGARLHRFGHAG